MTTTVKDRPQTMTKQELEEAEKRVEGKVSPFNSQKIVKNGKTVIRPATPMPTPKMQEVVAPDGHVRATVGVFSKPAKIGHGGTLKRFAYIQSDRAGWIEMSPDDAKQYEADRILVAYDPDEGVGLIKTNPTPIPEKKGV
jgi:hypothetical protein